RVAHAQDVVPEVTHAGHDALEVVFLVEGRKHHENFSELRLPLGEPALDADPRSLTRSTCFSMSRELSTGLTLVGAELRHVTGTSAIFTPRLRAWYNTSGS